MAAVTDDADAAYWNPGGLGFQQSFGLAGATRTFLPDFPGRQSFLSAGFGIPQFRGLNADLNVGLSLTYFDYGESYLLGTHGDTVAVWRTWMLRHRSTQGSGYSTSWGWA
jgi:hypothetical protein